MRARPWRCRITASCWNSAKRASSTPPPPFSPIGVSASSFWAARWRTLRSRFLPRLDETCARNGLPKAIEIARAFAPEDRNEGQPNATCGPSVQPFLYAIYRWSGLLGWGERLDLLKLNPINKLFSRTWIFRWGSTNNECVTVEFEWPNQIAKPGGVPSHIDVMHHAVFLDRVGGRISEHRVEEPDLLVISWGGTGERWTVAPEDESHHPTIGMIRYIPDWVWTHGVGGFACRNNRPGPRGHPPGAQECFCIRHAHL